MCIFLGCYFVSIKYLLILHKIFENYCLSYKKEL